MRMILKGLIGLFVTGFTAYVFAAMLFIPDRSSKFYHR